MRRQPFAKERLERKLFPQRSFHIVIHVPEGENPLWEITVECLGGVIGRGSHVRRLLAEERAAYQALKALRKMEQSSSPQARTRHALGEVANERGHKQERRVVEALQRLPPGACPEWLHEVRISTAEEDRLGIDVAILTDVGWLFVQVKSSEIGRRRFLEKKRPTLIATIIVKPDEPEDRLARRMLSLLAEQRKAVLRLRGT